MTLLAKQNMNGVKESEKINKQIKANKLLMLERDTAEKYCNNNMKFIKNSTQKSVQSIFGNMSKKKR